MKVYTTWGYMELSEDDLKREGFNTAHERAIRRAHKRGEEAAYGHADNPKCPYSRADYRVAWEKGLRYGRQKLSSAYDSRPYDGPPPPDMRAAQAAGEAESEE